MKRQLKRFLIVGLLVLVGAGTRLEAAVGIDQQQSVIDVSVGGLAIGGMSQQKLAQVVTTGMSGFLTEVRLPLYCKSAVLVLEIQGVTGEQPNGSVLTSETFVGTTLPTSGGVTFQSFAFSTPVLFSQGDRFAIVLKADVATAGGYCAVFQGPIGNPYAGGNGFFDARPNVAGVWVGFNVFAGARFDLPFQTVVETPPVKEVGIDIRPWEYPNNINHKSRGKIPVAILSASDLDASTEVDRESLTFGSTGEEARPAHCESADVNGDGLPDLICLFSTQQALFRSNDSAGVLKGFTLSGVRIRGEDSIRIVP